MAADSSAGDRGLDVFSWLAINTFLMVIVFVIYPVKIPIRFTLPFTNGKRFSYHLVLNLATAPWIGIIFLLATTSIGAQVLRDGFIGTAGIQPYSIMILFYALAYICISLDMTGVLQFSAFWVSQRAGSRGKTLFAAFFVLTTVMSALTSNDVVILTGTAFLVYFTKVAEINPPTAFLMSEFVSANIASMFLYIGNPTNVVVSQAYGISFIEYSAWMATPTVICIIIAYLTLSIVYRSPKYVPRAIQKPEDNPKSVLLDPQGATFGFVVLVICLGLLIGTSFAGVPVWEVTLPCAVVMAIRDFFYDWKNGGVKPSRDRQGSRIVEDGLNALEGLSMLPTPSVLVEPTRGQLPLSSAETVVVTDGKYSPIQPPHDTIPLKRVRNAPVCDTDGQEMASASNALTTPDFGVQNQSNSSPIISTERDDSIQTLLSVQRPSNAHIPTADDPTFTRQDTTQSTMSQSSRPPRYMPSFVQPWTKRFPTVWGIIRRMPWKILPFAIGMFILVEALASLGWTAIFANALAKCTPNYIAAVYFIGVLSIVLCSFLNNLPMTILMSKIMQHPNFANNPDLDDVTLKGAIFALIIGSNLGACLTLVGSLAGIMWDHILKTKGVRHLGYWAFLKWNLLILPMIALGACSVLILELYIIYR